MKTATAHTFHSASRRAAVRTGRGFHVPAEVIVIAALVMGASVNALHIVLG